MIKLFSRPKPAGPAEFWTWIQSANGRRALGNLLSPSSQESQRAVSAVTAELRKVNPKLVWGYSPGCLEISADGIRDMIPAVEELVATAPVIDGLQVVAFRQPSKDETFNLQVGGRSVELKSTLASAHKCVDGRYDIILYIPLPQGTPEPTLRQVGFILLDHALGEHFVMTKLGGIECRCLSEARVGGESVPLLELRELTS